MVTYPKNWTLNRIGNIADITTGKRDVKDSVNNGEYPFYVRSNEVERIDIADFDCEAVLTAGDGGIGKIFHYINGKFTAHQRVYVISNFKEVDGKYFYYYFSNNFLKEVEKYTAKSTVDSVRLPMISNMKIPLPPLEEQKYIASILSDIDEHVDNLTKLIEKKKAIREGALEDLISGRTRIDGFDSDWKEVELGEISKLQDGTHGTFRRTNEGHYLLSAKNVFNNKLIITENESKVSDYDFEQITANGFPKIGDILLSCVGTIGRCCICDVDGLAFQRSVAFIRSHIVNNLFLLYVLQGVSVQTQLLSSMNASAQGGIYLGALKKIVLRLPVDVKEQEAIAQIIKAMDEEIEALEIEMEKIIQIREGAMDDLLTGRVRLKI